MPEWIEPVFDRTEEDVEYAKAYNKSPSESAASEYKGALNASDLNRIEGNCAYLSALLHSCGYTSHVTVKTDWTMTDFPTLAEFTRIRDNITELMRAYAQAEDMPDMRTDSRTDYVEINNMEFDLYRINEMIANMKAIYIYSGELYEGEL